MADLEFLHNSEVLDVLDEILHWPMARWQVIELAGRGIAAEARLSLAGQAGKTQMNNKPAGKAMEDALAYADRLIELSDVVDDLVGLWQHRRAADIDDTDFEADLNKIINRLEAWPMDDAATPQNQ